MTVEQKLLQIANLLNEVSEVVEELKGEVSIISIDAIRNGKFRCQIYEESFFENADNIIQSKREDGDYPFVISTGINGVEFFALSKEGLLCEK